MKQKKIHQSLSCPLPSFSNEVITNEHGAGGAKTHWLIENIFRPAWRNSLLDEGHDSAVFNLSAPQAMTTDSYVVQPLFFPSSNIGDLAVCGTYNDLVVAGAIPRYLTCSFILHEGLPLSQLQQVVETIKARCLETGLTIVTGDTKVIASEEHGLFINTAGIGEVVAPHMKPSSIRAGDEIIVTGGLAAHGASLLLAREKLEIETPLESDVAPLLGLRALITSELATSLHCARDLTRGGLAQALVELAKQTQLAFEIEEKSIPVEDDVRGLCEIMGLDPLYLASEGQAVLFVDRQKRDETIKFLQKNGFPMARTIGKASPTTNQPDGVQLLNMIGTKRPLTPLISDPLPRIC